MSWRRSSGGLEHLLLWVVIHSFSVWLMGIIVPALNISGFLSVLLATGIGITVVAKLFGLIQYRIRFRIGWNFFYWIIVHTIAFGVMNYMVAQLNITNPWAGIFVTGAGIAVIAKIVKNIRIGRSNRRVVFRKKHNWRDQEDGDEW